MKLSPVQLLESYLVKVSVDINDSYDDSLEGEHELAMEHMSHIAYISASQDEDASSERQYAIVLGIRSDVDKGDVLPYKFEIIINGIISINRKARDQVSEIDDMAVKYGYTMLYGQIRERLSGLTSRMRKGTLILPTMSFMDETFPLTPSEDSTDDQKVIRETPV